jgi:glycosyltransferase involved in cell wall biosynthesis
MIIMPLFKLIHANALNRARIILAAASRDEINRFKVEMRQYGFRKDIIYYPTAVNTQLFFPRDKVKMRQKYNLPMNKPIFIFVGRLAKVKGIDFLIDSTLLFKNKYGDCQLLIVGDGEQYDYLNNYVVKKGLQEDVLFLGNCTSERVAEYIGASDIFVVGSYYEGFSVAMVEAVVSGRPIVSTEVSGAKDLIKFGVNGYIVSERNPTLFVESMKKALFLEEEAINYSKLYSNKYDERNFWEMLIEQCIGQY